MHAKVLDHGVRPAPAYRRWILRQQELLAERLMNIAA